jgi:hypothetical protein
MSKHRFIPAVATTLALLAAITIGGCTSLFSPTLTPVARDPAYAGSYPIVSTSQTGF